MAFLRNYFGLGKTVDLDDEKHAIRALPSTWYTSQEMYELERRAIFSKKWLLTTHKLRFPESGDWLRYDIAGFDVIIAKDNKGKINAFHNVCRHRAYPVVTKDQGHSLMFSCKYHGWSYGLSGNLAKAPGYQELEGFDKSQNSLLPIHVHIDDKGFIWINLDGSKVPEIAWSDDFDGVDMQDRYSNYNFEDYEFDHSWEMEGDYNWKILADNYNECYHCKTTHPDIPKLADLESYYVKTKAGHIQHYGNPTKEQIESGFRVAATYFFPNASMNVTPHFFFMQRFVPSGPTKSTMRYEVYRKKGSSDADFEVISAMYKRIMSEDKELCTKAQKNLAAGVFVNGEMHPRMEKGPLFFQSACRDLVMAHHRREADAGQEIQPARQQLPPAATVSEKDVDFCSMIDCSSKLNREALAF